jgi:hypothetical protein
MNGWEALVFLGLMALGAFYFWVLFRNVGD